jgi:hypothetical protein
LRSKAPVRQGSPQERGESGEEDSYRHYREWGQTIPEPREITFLATSSYLGDHLFSINREEVNAASEPSSE